jgi:hypothetical protein
MRSEVAAAMRKSHSRTILSADALSSSELPAGPGATEVMAAQLPPGTTVRQLCTTCPLRGSSSARRPPAVPAIARPSGVAAVHEREAPSGEAVSERVSV